MGRERTNRVGLLDAAGMRAETETLMQEFLRFTSEAVTPDSFVGTMSGGERQGVAIAERSTSRPSWSSSTSRRWGCR